MYSRIEHKILSAGNKYFPGLKILYSRQENIENTHDATSKIKNSDFSQVDISYFFNNDENIKNELPINDLFLNWLEKVKNEEYDMAYKKSDKTEYMPREINNGYILSLNGEDIKIIVS